MNTISIMPPQLITIIAPCYNENRTAIKFLEQLENTLNGLPYTFSIVIVNDGSTDGTLPLLSGFSFRSAGFSLHIVDLETNTGHQAAIYQGLRYARALASQHFIIMDSDGEDSPAAIPMLLQHLDADIVHVVRSSRKDPVFFKVCYYCYKAIFRALTGKQMNYGNFCLISRQVLDLAVQQRFSHFAAFLSRQKCTTRFISADKEERIGGQSKMGFRKLLRHALRSFKEYKGYNEGLLFKRSVSR